MVKRNICVFCGASSGSSPDFITLAEKIGKDTANDLMHDVAKYALENNLTLYDASLENEIISKHISKSELKLILNPETYIGLAAEQAQIIIKEIELKRAQLR